MPALTQLRRVSEKSDLVGNSLNRSNGTAFLPALGAIAFFSSSLLLPKSPCCCSVPLGFVPDLQEKEGRARQDSNLRPAA